LAGVIGGAATVVAALIATKKTKTSPKASRKQETVPLTRAKRQAMPLTEAQQELVRRIQERARTATIPSPPRSSV
jgi:hypothetical protein